MDGEGGGGEEERGEASGHTWLGLGRGQGECLDRHQGAIFTLQQFLPWETCTTD